MSVSKEVQFGWSGILLVLLCVVLMALVGVFVKTPINNNDTTAHNKPGPVRMSEQVFMHELCQPAFTPKEESGECLCTVRIQKVAKVGKDLRATTVTVFAIESEPCDGP